MDKTIGSSKDRVFTNISATIFLILWFFIFLNDNTPNLLWGKFGGLFIGGTCAIIAAGKNRNPFVWFVAGTWFILISAVILLCLRPLHDRLCPFCRKGISNEATACPYCQRDIPAIYNDIAEIEPAKTYYG